MMLKTLLFSLGLICVVVAHEWDEDAGQDEIAMYRYLNRSRRAEKYRVHTTSPWPKAILPYIISAAAMPNKRNYFRMFAVFEDMSCIRMLPWKKNMSSYGLTRSGHMLMTNADACVSTSQGYSRSAHTSCCALHECMHELGHTLGFPHEHPNQNFNGWIRINWNNVYPSNKNVYTKNPSEGWPHDITSVMHYKPWMYAVRDGSMSVLFPELSIHWEYYYFFKEIALRYTCGSINQCVGKDFKCENAGYRTVVHGICQCKCPTGLDPADLCRTPLKKVTNVSWPKGKYALPQMKEGCPKDGSFQKGQILFSGIDGFSKPKTSHVKGNMNGKEADLNFCTRNVDDYEFDSVDAEKFNWPIGLFCFYMKGDKCPKAFTASSFEYNVTASEANGQVPEGTYTDKKVKVNICCQYRGFHVDPVLLPTEKPFSLIQYDKTCQEVTGMHWEKDSFTITNSAGFKTDSTTKKWLDRKGTSLTVSLCNYRKADMNCGGSITLSKSKPVVTIEMDAKGRTDVECTWVIRGDDEDSALVLDFDELNVKKDGKHCQDTVEVRHSKIGQYGLKYCGDELDHSIRSITNKLLVRFITYGKTDSSFKATIRVTPDEDMCYDVQGSRGADYNGAVNYTRLFEPCLPWASVSECYHNPYLHHDLHASLDGNACRNPDRSFRPWCYTDKNGCKRNYCDVCGLEVPHDNVDYCDKLKDVGFCTRDAALAVKYCPKTCFDLLPSNQTPLKKYTEITCGKPTPPVEGVIVGDTKTSYKLGETVQYKCDKPNSVLTSRCMTSGQWSEVTCKSLICPVGFVPFEDTCYQFMHFGKRYTKKDGTELCKSLGAKMAVPHNIKENNFIRGLSVHSSTWVGINDTEVEGQWREDNGSLVTWTNWNKGEPNDAARGEDCTEMKDNGLWNDYPCSRTSRVACSLPRRERECDDLLGNKCQQLLTDRPTLCDDLPAFVQEYCTKTCRICPGFDAKCSVQNTNPNVITLTTQTTISVGESVNYKCERFSYPTKGSNLQACLSNGKLSGEPLECEQCPLGFKMVNNACYGLIGGRIFSYKDAQDECGKLDGFLAMPKTKVESDAISSIGLGQKIWIGASDDDHEGSFVWDDKSSLAWTNWDQGEPKSKGRNHDCVVMNSDKTWTNVRCGDMDLTTVCTIPKSGSQNCWDRRNKGATYDGKVNITVRNNRCAHWSENNCHTNPFKKGKERYNLESNYCRNPDNSDDGPWCYIGPGCRWRYCDVCGEDSKNIVDIRCGAPPVPSDGKIVSIPRDSYRLGDEVTIQCKRNKHLATTTCLTSGNWSPIGTACTECPIGYSLYHDTCYRYMDKQLSYDNAVKECGKMGGHLPRPRTIEENDFLRKMNHNRYTWFDARKTPTDEDQTFKWSDGTKVRWLLDEDQPEFECGFIDQHGEWASTRCDFIHPKQNLICAVPKLDKPECKDFLEGQCQKWLLERPTMCSEYKEFAKEFCTNTCGQCQGAAQCKVPSAKGFATVLTKKSTVKSGDVVVFRCKRGTFAISGNTERVCLPNGQMSGSDVICGDCPPGYKKYKDFCYGLVNRKLKFHQAVAECKKVNGYVASPKNEVENNFIHSQSGRNTIWLGATDTSEEGKFMWQDGSKVEWTNWHHGQPDDWHGEDCSSMKSDNTWNDRDCNSRLKVVCATPSLGDETCYDKEDLGASYDGKVSVSENGKACIPWAAATHCRDNPFQKGDEQMNLVENYCRNPDESLAPWCYTDKQTCEKHYCKVCDHEPVHDVSKVRCPSPNIPSDGMLHDKVKGEYKVGEKVLILCKSSEVNGEVTTCLTSGHWSPVGLACPVCPSGYDYYRNQCYKFVDEPLTFIDAHKYCVKDAGGFIASPTTPMENDFIARMRHDKAIWVGVNDIETEGRWEREDGGLVKWSNWGPGEPNDWGNEDAAVMKSRSSVWNDRSQWTTKPFVCQTHVRDEGSRLCEDLLLVQCQNFIAKDPGMCNEHKDFAVQYCAKTCDMCHLKTYVENHGQIMVGSSSTLTNGAKPTPVLRAYFGTGFQYRIAHAGKLVTWEFYSSSPIKTGLQVWRKRLDRNVYQLVGQNIITTGKGSSEQRYDVPEASQIQVKEGDYIGIVNGETGGIRFSLCDKIEYRELSGHFKWSGLVSSVEDFKVGRQMKFSENESCLLFSFRAIVKF